MNINARLRALETQLTTEPITLAFADGSTATVPSGRNHIAKLLRCAVLGEHSPELDLIARSTTLSEPSGSHLVELARAICLSPTEEGQ